MADKKHPSYYFYRERMSWFLLTVFLIIPFIQLNDTPFILINFFEKKFFLAFKQVYPQDFFLLAGLMIAFFIVFLIISYRYGRVFCGWVCPQTVFLEFVFKKIDKQIYKTTDSQTVQKILKISAYLAVSLLVSLVLLNYQIGVQNVVAHLAHLSTIPVKYILFVSIFTTLFFIIFSQIREKSCTLFCPYGRVQGIFYGSNTNMILYDINRGEPRGKNGSLAYCGE